MEPRFPLDDHRDGGERRERSGRLHDAAAVRPDRDRHAGRRGQRRGPGPGREEDPVGADVAVARARAGHPGAVAAERLDAHALDETDALERRGGGEPGERIQWRAVAVAQTEAPAFQVARADPRHEGRDPLGREQLDLHAEALVERHRLAEGGHALRGLGDEEVAVLLEGMAAAGERVEVAPELGRDLRQPHVELVRELVADATQPALRRPGSEHALLDEHDVGLAALAQEERRRDPAAVGGAGGGERGPGDAPAADGAEARQVMGEGDDPLLFDGAREDRAFRLEGVQRKEILRRDPREREVVAVGHEV